MGFSDFIRGYRKESVLAPLFKFLEAVFELCVPLAVASLIDDGILKGDMQGLIGAIDEVHEYAEGKKLYIVSALENQVYLFDKLDGQLCKQMDRLYEVK